MKTLWRILSVALCLVLAAGVVACAPTPKQAPTPGETPAYPEVSFIVFSDPHIYDASLGTEGKAFEDYIAKDRKLIRESVEILESAIEMIKAEKASFVLVPGDLTKDGERVSHELLAKYLGQLENAGKQIYVVPGNHDVLNPHSYKYEGDKTELVPTVKPEEFAQIYAEFGYKKALFRDPASLSYVAEPQKGLWLLALDACRYAENVAGEESITDGKFSPQTLQWIEEMLKKAAAENKAVIAMMHHGIMEHYPSQEKNYGAYIVDDFPIVSKLLATYNARLVFTGHYHAQDITVERFADTGKFVFDIETGSLVTYPCPYRVVSIDKDQKATIRTERITKIRSRPTDFPEYAKRYLENGIAGIASRTIQKYGIEAAEADVLAGQVAKAFVAHYSGDEKLPAGQIAISAEGMSGRARLVVMNRKDLVEGLWTDLEPQDNNITIDLKTGQWQ